MRAEPTILELVRRAEAVHRVDLAEHDGRLVAAPAGRLPEALALELANRKQAVLSYLRERSCVEHVLDKVSVDVERDELHASFFERVDIQELVHGADRQTAIAVAWRELGETLEHRRERALQRREESDKRRDALFNRRERAA